MSTASFPSLPEALAEAVHAELPGELSAPENIRWVGRYRLRGKDELNRYSVYSEADGRSGLVYTTPLEVAGDHPLVELESVTVPFPLSRDDAWPTVEAELGVAGMEARGKLKSVLEQCARCERIERVPVLGVLLESVGASEAGDDVRSGEWDDGALLV